MDLRVVKTRKNIRQAFLELRSKKALEKIKVTKLCELALINKTTFYKHYQDIYALSEEIENETILSILESFEHMDSLFTDPERFMKGLYFAFVSHEELVLILFSGRMDILVNKVQRQLMAHYPRISNVPEKDIMLSFLLWGAFHVLIESRYEETVLLNTLTKVAKDIISFIDGQELSSGAKKRSRTS
jgi:AcrR family transcriptional regulator